MLDVADTKVHDEARQGEAFAPFSIAPVLYKKHFYIESYGCAMNFADSEIVASILNDNGYGATRNAEDADLILINTCSIREKAELTVRKRLTEFRKLKVARPGTLVGVLGCMAERLKSKFLEEEKLVDMVVGPDAYRSLPGLVEEAEGGQKGVNVILSRDETYGDISPIRLNSNGIMAFVSIMRGCNNMCSFCVVPFTRGRERSRDADSIVAECEDLFRRGFKEVTLLGQNVDSYLASASPSPSKGGGLNPDSLGVMQPPTAQSIAQSSTFPPPLGEIEGANGGRNEPALNFITFANLLERVALISPLLRVRFSTSHPKDITDDVLHTMAKYENICNYIHLPVQSGSSRILQLMNRTYSREWYMAKVDRIREIIPDCGISSDMISGFCTETEEDHQQTLSLMEYCKYHYSYMYFYSERPGTLAERRYEDDVPLDVKKRRLEEIVQLQNRISLASFKEDVGKTFKVLIEGNSKKSDTDWMGRTGQSKVVVFAKENYDLQAGDYVHVEIESCTQGTLLGKIKM
jgi:tRNA-2-methylthio-N6-dimethylallyladenosine synthase